MQLCIGMVLGAAATIVGLLLLFRRRPGEEAEAGLSEDFDDFDDDRKPSEAGETARPREFHDFEDEEPSEAGETGQPGDFEDEPSGDSGKASGAGGTVR